MNRRTLVKTLAAAAASSFQAKGFAVSPTWDSIKQHTVPDWYSAAKLGIFIHWGLYSVPAWATPTGELGKIEGKTWFARNPYAEWYLNTLRIQDSPTYKHHVETYGANFDYYRFADEFNTKTAEWNPSSWASLFRKTGARYVVLTTKHHDGFRLWPSRVDNPRRPAAAISAKRDLVGDLTVAVRQSGMKMGLYYSGGLDWTFTEKPIADFPDLRTAIPQSEEYARYADAHWTELTDRYQPAVMWNDIGYPKAGKLPELFAHYYNSVPAGVINNRFGVDFADFTTPEYAKYDKITPNKWESCRGLGFSFGYNRLEGPEQVITPPDLAWLLSDIVSKNGNLLLNIGPRPDGSISEIQLDRLNKLGNWLNVNGEGIFDSKPWLRASSGDNVRFTVKDGALYAFVKNLKPAELTIPGLSVAPQAKVHVLGSPGGAAWKQSGSDLVLAMPAGAASGAMPLCVRISPAPQS